MIFSNGNVYATLLNKVHPGAVDIAQLDIMYNDVAHSHMLKKKNIQIVLNASVDAKLISENDIF